MWLHLQIMVVNPVFESVVTVQDSLVATIQLGHWAVEDDVVSCLGSVMAPRARRRVPEFPFVHVVASPGMSGQKSISGSPVFPFAVEATESGTRVSYPVSSSRCVISPLFFPRFRNAEVLQI